MRGNGADDSASNLLKPAAMHIDHLLINMISLPIARGKYGSALVVKPVKRM